MVYLTKRSNDQVLIASSLKRYIDKVYKFINECLTHNVCYIHVRVMFSLRLWGGRDTGFVQVVVQYLIIHT